MHAHTLVKLITFDFDSLLWPPIMHVTPMLDIVIRQTFWWTWQIFEVYPS